MFKHLLIAVLFVFSVSLLVQAKDKPQPPKLVLGSFSEAQLDDWEAVEFNDDTEYKLVAEAGEQSILRATSRGTASGLFRKYPVDLEKYPYINWRWKLNTALPELAEQTKQGDDYAARLYVVVSDGWFFWQTKALNYVWSSQTNPPDSWPNAYAPDNTLMLPLRNAKNKSGEWYQEKRNVYQDLKAWLGKSYDKIEAIAIMTDADDSALEAQAEYGDIYFSAE